jgi:uncharacterized protein YjiS (DUF1127 family)
MTHYEANLSIQSLPLHRGERRFAGWLADAGTALLGHILAWHERARSRRHLGGLNSHLLRDIGLDRATAQIESDKPFWQG